MRNNRIVETRRLRQMNATVERYESGAIVLVSYSTPVAAEVGGRLYFLPEWHCSVSTMRQVRIWSREYWGRELYAADVRNLLKTERATLLSGWSELYQVLESDAKVGA